MYSYIIELNTPTPTTASTPPPDDEEAGVLEARVDVREAAEVHGAIVVDVLGTVMVTVDVLGAVEEAVDSVGTVEQLV